jgi:hypothetical protein
MQFKFTVSKNMNSWFIKQPISGECASDISASSSTEESHDSPALKKKGEKISDFLTLFFLSTHEQRMYIVCCMW